MTDTRFKSWQSVQEEVLARIHSRKWKPGDFIPNEADLAQEFGCARATVNRALQNLADEGLLDRRRKAGTRVATHPVRKATMYIPIIRQEIRDRGLEYGYELIRSEKVMPPREIGKSMGSGKRIDVLHIVCLHTADGRPYVLEDRWLNPKWVSREDFSIFSDTSPNEWLVTHVPFTEGNIVFSAISAGKTEAELLSCKEGDALFVIDRTTRDKQETITSVRLTFFPGYRIETTI
ncbi:GntR family transcriptional regulator [Hyphomonas jannaschiana]|jgi:GntR family histidine utilization transcriptional repressor|uniref:GntR family transcriptional regulator n=1 Tax=Hyphomonas jannaschiana VP2 TaxID=1280952 RepID=A0A059FHZ5_9PROT|nr:GntR family transcriptional regulator [Hyphomonas jannaschiana]KCZ90269.1 GntR family transcriptional regulator [Hyphomonas jannaschiana VP2]|tara:strand:- start:490 stop:1191 length:702 start_codon:yes stop_codon:yes gene_type:complete